VRQHPVKSKIFGESIRYAQARAHLEESLVLARELGHRQRIGSILHSLGQVAYEEEELALAARYLQESLTLAREVHQPLEMVMALRHWGEVHLRQRQIDEAEAAFTEALDLAQALLSQVQEAHALFGLARVALAQSNPPEAQRLGQESLNRFEASGFYRGAEVRAWLAELPLVAPPARGQTPMTTRAALNGKAPHATTPQ
jgi:tetratricopeptide (TPR) repeat protein